MFQSPIRRERSCSATWCLGVAHNRHVSIPYSSGKVLLLRSQAGRDSRSFEFQSPIRRERSCSGLYTPSGSTETTGFQSPIRRERSCSKPTPTEVPPAPPSFNPLFVGKGLAPSRATLIGRSFPTPTVSTFQSPIRRERSCSAEKATAPILSPGKLVSIPYSSGKVLLHYNVVGLSSWKEWRFNPLFVGKGLAPRDPGHRPAPLHPGFNPLFVGKGLAPQWLLEEKELGEFVSIPYSSGKVLLPLTASSETWSSRPVSIPYSSGKVLLRTAAR